MFQLFLWFGWEAVDSLCTSASVPCAKSRWNGFATTHVVFFFAGRVAGNKFYHQVIAICSAA